jgi:hypothetical protein
MARKVGYAACCLARAPYSVLSVATARLTRMNAPASRARTARPAYPHFLTFVRLAHTL